MQALENENKDAGLKSGDIFHESNAIRKNRMLKQKQRTYESVEHGLNDMWKEGKKCVLNMV